MLELKHLYKEFKGHAAVSDVSFDVGLGERVALLGPNGAGKTTTLMMALGVTTPDRGEVFIDGLSMRSSRARALESVGFSAAYMNPAHSMTVIETLRVAAGFAGLSLRSPAVGEAIDRMDIGHLIKRKGGELSSGQKTLVGLARAAISRPRILVLDEPTAYLDPSMSLQVRNKIEAMCNEWGSSLLITSHNMRDIDHLCSRVVFMSRGSILYNTEPQELRRIVGVDDLDDLFIDLANQQEDEGGEQHAKAG